MKRTTKRLWAITGLMVMVATGLGLLLYVFQSQLQFFYDPTQFVEEDVPLGRVIRAGGMVVDDSINQIDGLTTEFSVTDYENTLAIRYTGLLPPMFREGQGVVATGVYNPENNRFNATKLMTKHDENYMPPELKEALKDKHE